MTQTVDTEVMEARYRAAKESFNLSRNARKGEGMALGVVFEGYADTMDSIPLMQKAAHASKLFCIAAAFIIPNLLMAFEVL